MSMNRRFLKQAGQGMTEYIIIVALIAVAAIGVYSFFGKTLRNQTASIATELGGGDGATATSKAAAAAGKAATDADKGKGLDKFTGGNKVSN